ncbi:hypothetical protein HYH02_000280 [Chlamydomonas schloesseri]|uniref:TATA-binding protein interacting (TIP20) domain-containing protein n=1 Tax=Chlamydomonas schloesseri TaxID=2026947 RepID=A0A835WLW6_9CHLO|nr:hypothetical protein HYH02_000280 [Chlamydomonas schloesseri]|eukprot:KAG2450178.1 hypothetical protein HYH02_000280 [Chlamydomonas schloesseri]
MTSTAIIVILEKITSKDKDFRYMATSDLLHELQKDSFKVDMEQERKLCNVILTQLEDPSGDISNLAVSCLGHLARKVAEPRAEDLVRQLCDKVAGGAAGGAGAGGGGSSSAAASKARDAQREIAAIGLKALLKELAAAASASLAANATAIIAGRMLEGLAAHKDDADVTGHVLDILAELIGRFGGLLPADTQGRVRDALLAALMGEGRLLLRKKALQGLAALSVYLSDDALGGVVGPLLAALQQPGVKPDFARTYVQAVGQVSRAVGYRFGRYLAVAVPLAVSHCDKAAEGDDELREHCLQALEGFVLRCPHDTRPLLEAVLAAALRYLRYDPNFAADDDDEDGGGGSGGDDDMSGGEDDEDADGDDGDEYSDDEDMSWKVRRAATRILMALVSRYPDALPALYKAALGELVGRFEREREEGVKGDVFAAVGELLGQVGATAGRYTAAAGDAASPVALLAADTALIVKAAAKQLKDKSAKTRVGALGVLRQLVAVQAAVAADAEAGADGGGAAAAVPGSVVDVLVPGLLAALNDKSGNTGLKIEALSFLRQLLAAAPPALFQPHTKTLGGGVFACVGERYYKVAAEALRCCEALVGVLRPEAAAPVPPSQQPQVAPLYKAVMARLSATDQDQEVKECAISAMAAAAARLGDSLAPELPGVLRVLLERLRNETTRLTAVKAITTLASSPLVPGELLATGGGGGGSADGGVAGELTSFLRKANRLLRQASLVALEALASRYPPAFDGAVLPAAVEAAAALVGDGDVALAALALRFLVGLMAMPGPAGAAAAAAGGGQGARAGAGAGAQGGALEVLEAFFAALAAASGQSSDALLALLLEAGRAEAAAAATGAAAAAGSSSKQAQHSVARCVAALATSPAAAAAGAAAGAAGANNKVAATVDMLLSTVNSAKDPGSQRLALLCLGEIGGRADLAALPAVAAAASAALAAPGSPEEVRAAASHALGGVTRGNLRHFMPGLLAQIGGAAAAPKQQYLLLQALNDVITTLAAPSGAAKAADLGPETADQVLALLLGAAEAEEECRAVVAECCGRLALLHPGKVLPALLERTRAPSANMRAMVVSAVKAAVVDRPHDVDAALQGGGVLLDFLRLMGDEDRHVRRAAVVALSGCAHAKPGLVAAGLPGLLPLLYGQTAVREDLIRVVDLGPFKHRIDDGLELRKAAFECLDILHDCGPLRDRLEPAAFLGALESGLGDHADVKAPCHTLLTKLAATDPGAVLTAAERLVVPLEKTLTTRLKSDAVKQEIDRHEDMLRSCLRCVDSLAHVPGADSNAAFQGFLRKVVLATPALKDKYALVQRERLEAEAGAAGGDAMDTA